MNDARHVVVGTAGHIDHGKSTLVKALTGTDPDRWEEEKRRGITIDLGFAFTEIAGRGFSFVDVPGHERFVHNMLAGATGLDMVLLVVAADESVMPQTLEHLAICQLLGLRGGVVALTRIDLADAEYVELVAEEVREALAGTFLEQAPVLRVSGVTGEGLEDLRRALAEQAADLGRREEGPWPRLPIDRVFAARGFGTVVTGTLQGGGLEVGRTLVAIPGGQRCRIRGLQVHSRNVSAVQAHQRVAVNLQGIDREYLRRGMVLVPEGRDVVARVVDAWISVIQQAPVGIEDGQRLRLHHGTAELLCRVRMAGGRALAAGEQGAVQLRIEQPLAALPGDRFILRRYSPLVTLGGGRIAELDPPRRRRRQGQWAERVRALARAEPERRVVLQVEAAGIRGRRLASLVREGVDPDALAAARPEGLVLLAGEHLLAADGQAALVEALVERLAAYHAGHPLDPGPAPEELRAACAPTLSPAAWRDLLDRAMRAGKIVASREAVRLPGHDDQPAPSEVEALDRALEVLEAAGLEALDEASWLGAGDARLRPLLGWAERTGRAVRLGNGAWIARRPWEAMIAVLREEAAAGRKTLDVAAFKNLFSLTRKYAIPILEALDDRGVTRRAGSARVLRVDSEC